MKRFAVLALALVIALLCLPCPSAAQDHESGTKASKKNGPIIMKPIVIEATAPGPAAYILQRAAFRYDIEILEADMTSKVLHSVDDAAF